MPSAFENLYLKPYYALEQFVASRSIPSIPKTMQRMRFKDCPKEATGPVFDHSLWDSVLKSYVSTEGFVDYDGLRSDARFDEYLGHLAESPPPTDELDRFAYHLNAYNALCCDLIAKNPGIKSILDLSTKELPVWDSPAATKLGGRIVTLNQIEHERLREQWDEPVLHACIVCASTSCPALANFAFQRQGLEDAMKSRAAAWVNDPNRGCLAKNDKLFLSRIFLWFEADFHNDNYKGPLDFIRKNNGKPSSEQLAIRYFEYDWSLNTQKQSS